MRIRAALGRTWMSTDRTALDGLPRGERSTGRQVTKVLAPFALVLAFVITTAAPAQAVAGLGKPAGRLLEAIVAHEMGHCLGYWEHGAAPSIMRSGFGMKAISQGSDSNTPSAADIDAIQKSRTDTVAGETATALVQYPFINDSVPVFNRTGRRVVPAAAQWNRSVPLDIHTVRSEPANGVTIQFDPSVNGTGALAVTVAVIVSNGSFYQVTDCTIKIGTKVAPMMRREHTR